MSDSPLHGSGGEGDNSTVSTISTPIFTQTVETASGEPWSYPIIHSVQPQPITYYHVTEDKLEMLATMPRRKWGEFTMAALSGMVGAAPAAIVSIYSAYKGSWSFQLIDVIQILLFFFFGIWLLFQYSMSVRVSGDLLEEIKNYDKFKK